MPATSKRKSISEKVRPPPSPQLVIFCRPLAAVSTVLHCGMATAAGASGVVERCFYSPAGNGEVVVAVKRLREGGGVKLEHLKNMVREVAANSIVQRYGWVMSAWKR